MRTQIGITLLLAAALPAQTTLQVPPGPVTPGTPFNVVLTNNTTTCIDVLASNVLTLLQPGGELIAPVLVGCGPVAFCLANGQSANLSYAAPASGPGSSGSFVLLCPYGSGAAARLDVGAPAAAFPDIHAYPTALPHGPGGHHLALPLAGNEWEFANTAAQPRTISPNVGIYAPGGAAPLAVAAFPGLVVPAGGVAPVSLPLVGLPPGPYTVQADWIDLGAGGPVTIRRGIEISSGTSLDLHVPGGHVVPLGGTLPARIAVTLRYYFASPPPWPYGFAVGYLPGTTTLPGGAILPLVPDVLALWSLQNGINGLVSGNVGTTTGMGVYCAHGTDNYAVGGGITLSHPGAALSGTTVRCAAFAIDPASGAFVASQPEEVTLQ